MLRERLLDPLALDGTQLPGTASAAAAGGLVAPADDIARFLAALLAGEIASRRSLVREILSTVRSDWPESEGYWARHRARRVADGLRRLPLRRSLGSHRTWACNHRRAHHRGRNSTGRADGQL